MAFNNLPTRPDTWKLRRNSIYYKNKPKIYSCIN